MSRTLKHTLARAFHKRLKAAYRRQPNSDWRQGFLAAYEAFPIAVTRVTRYGLLKRRYEAGCKVIDRRIARAKLKASDRRVCDD